MWANLAVILIPHNAQEQHYIKSLMGNEMKTAGRLSHLVLLKAPICSFFKEAKAGIGSIESCPGMLGADTGLEHLQTHTPFDPLLHMPHNHMLFSILITTPYPTISFLTYVETQDTWHSSSYTQIYLIYCVSLEICSSNTFFRI